MKLIYLSNQAVLLHDQKVEKNPGISWERKEVLRWNEKHFSSFLKAFSYQKLSQTWEVRFYIFVIILLCGTWKCFMNTFKTFINSFEAPQRSVKIKIKVNFFLFVQDLGGRVNAMEMTIELFLVFLSCRCACPAFFCLVFHVICVVYCEIRINVFFLY